MRISEALIAPVLLLALAMLPPGAAAQAKPATGDTIIVVDASGSMWGQVDGEAKIGIARRVFADLLQEWPEGQRLGVIAYGHRRKGDCTDIERIINVGAVDLGSAVERIDALKPKGRTPLTDAVEQAAEALRYQDVPATVILLTDGIETCDRDPCRLAETLERSGVAFTAHVVGFDIAAEDHAKVACIAERTGGRFLSASNADQLALAMRTVTIETVPVPPPPADVEITLLAVDAETGAELADVEWSVSGAEDALEIGDSTGTSLSLELPAGDYQVVARVPGAEVAETIQVFAGEPATHRIDIPLPLPDASVDAPAEAAAGSAIEVHWTGPDAKGDFIAIVEQGAPTGSYIKYRYTTNGSPAKLQIPDALGAYEVRYVLGRNDRTLASAPVTLGAVAATLEAPTEAPAGSEIEVHWSGPDNKGDYITIVEKGAPEGSNGKYRYTSNGSPAKLLVPDALGAYELRYLVGQSKRTLASHPITLVPVSASLIVGGPVVPGADVSIQWQGPDNKGDMITIVEPGAQEGSYTKYRYTASGSPVALKVPDAPGTYEVRYVVGQSKRTLTSAPLEVAVPEVTLSVLGEMSAGGLVEVVFEGPGRYQDLIEIVPAGAAADAQAIRSIRASQGSPVKMFAPPSPGDYELRYRYSDTGEVAASIPLRVE